MGKSENQGDAVSARMSEACSLSGEQSQTLSLLCDTFVPKIEDSREEHSKYYNRTATSIGVHREIERIILQEFTDDQKEQIARLLNLIESPLLNLALSGTFKKFSEMSKEQRERFLFHKFAKSRLALKRTAFQALKRIVCFTYYGCIPEGSKSNPNWDDIGYRARSDSHVVPYGVDFLEAAIIPHKDEVIECDVLVVGSGAGGSVIADYLAKAGWNIIVMEAADFASPEQYAKGQEYDLTRKLFEQRGRAATRDLSISLLEGHTLGGSTTVNWNTSIKPPDWLREEWEQVEGVSGLTGNEFDECIDYVWSALKVNRSESQLNPNNRVLYGGCKALGLSMPDDYDIIWRNAAGCFERCDYCTFGCQYGAKQCTPLNFLSEAKLTGRARFVFSSEAERILIRAGRAAGVEANFRATFHYQVRCKAVVLAAGSINTPAILLRSGIKRHVGRYLKLHPTTAISGLYNEPINMWAGPPQTVKVTKWLNIDGQHHGFWVESVPAHPGLFSSALPWTSGKEHKDLMLRMAHASGTIILLREIGEGSVEIDRKGRPLCDYSLSNSDKDHLKQGLVATAKILAASGAKEVSTLHSDGLQIASDNGSALNSAALDRFESEVVRREIAPNKIALFSAHIMGSARMGKENVSFCDDSAESYDLPGLYIGDASALPSSPGVNPMITIMSLARRNAKRIDQSLRKKVDKFLE